MSHNSFNSFEEQLKAAARDIVTADLAKAPVADPAAAEAIVAASGTVAAGSATIAADSATMADGSAAVSLAPAPVPAAAPQSHRIALWPIVGAAAACLVLGYLLPHPSAVTTEGAVPTARVEKVEIVRTDTIYRDRTVPQMVEHIIERPVVQTVEVVRVDTVEVPAPTPRPKHAPRSLGNDGFVYAYNTSAE